MYNAKTFTIQLALFLLLFIGNSLLLNAQETTEGYQTTSCGEETMITYGNGNIIMEGKRAVNYTFKIVDNKREVIFECKEDCGNSQEIIDLPPGRYRVIIRNENGQRICRRWVRLKRPACMAKSGRLVALERRVELRQNPARAALFINLKQYLGENGQLILSNQLGQPIRQIDLSTIDEEIVTINTSDVKNGIYYLNVQVEGYRVLSEKVLVQRIY